MKKIFALLLSTAMLFGVAACSAEGPGATTAAATTAAATTAAATETSAAEGTAAETSAVAEETTAAAATQGGTIALFMTHMSNEFTITLSGAVEAQVKARGYEYKVYDAKQDAAQQQNQIEQAITLGVNGIIIEPVSVDGIVPAVEAAKNAGIKVVIVNQRISKPEAADCYVGADAETTGRYLMEQVMKDIGGKGNLALLLGPMGSDGQVGRSLGFTNVIKEYPDVKVEFEGSADWQTEPALKLAENWLNSGKELNAIVAQNDGMAIGAAKAVSDAQLKDSIFVYGVDATSEGLQAVLDGNLKATVSQGTEDQGKLSADACADLIEGKTVEAETIVKNVVYTIDNAQAALDAIKKQ